MRTNVRRIEHSQLTRGKRKEYLKGKERIYLFSFKAAKMIVENLTGFCIPTDLEKFHARASFGALGLEKILSSASI